MAQSNDSRGNASDAVVPDESIVVELASMGFSSNGCRRALIATKNASAEVSIALYSILPRC